jgi:hypothetical protein
MIRGPEVAVGVPKADKPVFCGTRQGTPAMPQTPGAVERENCVVRTLVTLGWLNTLKASQINCSFTRSLSDTLRVTRGSKEISTREIERVSAKSGRAVIGYIAVIVQIGIYQPGVWMTGLCGEDTAN